MLFTSYTSSNISSFVSGHIYAIADCGGAVITSTCPECRCEIGGTSHQLLSSNSLATEMDGAEYPAWSDAANLAQ